MQNYSPVMTGQLNFIYIDILGLPEKESRSLRTVFASLCVTNLQMVQWGGT